MVWIDSTPPPSKINETPSKLKLISDRIRISDVFRWSDQVPVYLRNKFISALTGSTALAFYIHDRNLFRWMEKSFSIPNHRILTLHTSVLGMKKRKSYSVDQNILEKKKEPYIIHTVLYYLWEDPELIFYFKNLLFCFSFSENNVTAMMDLIQIYSLPCLLIFFCRWIKRKFIFLSFRD